MKTRLHDEKVSTVIPTGNSSTTESAPTSGSAPDVTRDKTYAPAVGGAKLPNERDESHDLHQADVPDTPQRDVIRQAAVDVNSGQVNTDLRDAPQFNKKNDPTPSPVHLKAPR